MKDKDKLQEAILKADMKSAEKIWKELDGEQTLASLLEKMTKDELVKIAKKYDVKGKTLSLNIFRYIENPESIRLASFNDEELDNYRDSENKPIKWYYVAELISNEGKVILQTKKTVHKTIDSAKSELLEQILEIPVLGTILEMRG